MVADNIVWKQSRNGTAKNWTPWEIKKIGFFLLKIEMIA